MGALCRMISPQWILLDAEVKDKSDCIRQLIAAMSASEAVQDADQLYADIMEREGLSSTSVGSGCAIPHAHSSTTSKTLVAAARLKNPIDFGDSQDGEVSLVFLMAGPKTDSGIHLKVLSKIARLLHDASTRDRFLSANDANEFYAVLCPSGA